MPYVNLKFSKQDPVTGEVLSSAQKRELVEKVTALVSDVTGRPIGKTFVVIEEIDNENWGISGTQLGEISNEQDQ